MKRSLGGRDVPAIGLGCMNVSHAYQPAIPEDDADRLLRRALDLGYRHFDTSRIYGLGRNEELVGRALEGRRSEVFLASKMGLFADAKGRRVDCSPAAIRAEVENSLRALRTDFIDLYYMHRRDFTVPIEESADAMGELIRAGKIGGYGLSEVSADTLRRAHAVVPVTAVQNEYSLASRNVELGVLRATAELGVALVAFSPVARGLLANTLRDPADLTERDMRRQMPRFTAAHWPANRALADRFNAIAAEQGVTPAQLSLAWVLSRGGHVHVIPGTANIAHLEENIARADWMPDDDVLDRLDALVNQRTVSGHRYAAAMLSLIDTEEFA